MEMLQYTACPQRHYAFGKKIDVILVDDHLVMRWGKSKKRIRENFQILVLCDGSWISDDEVKKGLRRMFFGSADFMQRMYDTHCCPV